MKKAGRHESHRIEEAHASSFCSLHMSTLFANKVMVPLFIQQSHFLLRVFAPFSTLLFWRLYGWRHGYLPSTPTLLLERLWVCNSWNLNLPPLASEFQRGISNILQKHFQPRKLEYSKLKSFPPSPHLWPCTWSRAHIQGPTSRSWNLAPPTLPSSWGGHLGTSTVTLTSSPLGLPLLWSLPYSKLPSFPSQIPAWGRLLGVPASSWLP